jgi:hypothetical protein
MLAQVKKSTKLGMVFKAYAKHIGVEPVTLAFLYDGHRIDANTPVKQQELENDDVIDAMIHTVGGIQ